MRKQADEASRCQQVGADVVGSLFGWDFMVLRSSRVHPGVHREAADPACEISPATSGSDHSRKPLATVWPDQIEREFAFAAARDRITQLLFVRREDSDALSA